MAFSVVASGIRDEIPLDNLFERKVVERIDPVDKVLRIEKEKNESEKKLPNADYVSYAYANVANAPSEREPAIQAAQIMSSPVSTMSPDTSFDQAWEAFTDRRFRHFPVLKNSTLVGLISDRDLLRIRKESGAAQNVSEFMRTRVLTASSDTLIRDIARVFVEQRIGAMPIVDGEVVVGMITRSDILKTIVNQRPLELWV